MHRPHLHDEHCGPTCSRQFDMDERTPTASWAIAEPAGVRGQTEGHQAPVVAVRLPRLEGDHPTAGDHHPGLGRQEVRPDRDGGAVNGLQFAGLMALILVGIVSILLTIPWAVERAMTVRLAELKTMMEAALAHGGSIDTLARDVRGKVESANELSRKAGEVASILKTAVDDHERRLREIEGHPVIRRLGGNGDR